jgi:hypothetical protein
MYKVFFLYPLQLCTAKRWNELFAFMFSLPQWTKNSQNFLVYLLHGDFGWYYFLGQGEMLPASKQCGMIAEVFTGFHLL